jgi:hypothetical protein
VSILWPKIEKHDKGKQHYDNQAGCMGKIPSRKKECALCPASLTQNFIF